MKILIYASLACTGFILGCAVPEGLKGTKINVSWDIPVPLTNNPGPLELQH